MRVEDIAREAFDAVAAEVDGPIQSATVTRTTQGTYNPATGQYAITTATATGRAIAETETAIADVFPGYVASEAETLYLIIELDWAPKQNDTLTIGGKAMSITKVRDVLGVAELFRVVAV